MIYLDVYGQDGDKIRQQSSIQAVQQDNLKITFDFRKPVETEVKVNTITVLNLKLMPDSSQKQKLIKALKAYDAISSPDAPYDPQAVNSDNASDTFLAFALYPS